jgi:hypothetical protein
LDSHPAAKTTAKAAEWEFQQLKQSGGTLDSVTTACKLILTARMIAALYLGFYVATTVVIICEYRSLGCRLSWGLPIVLAALFVLWPLFFANRIDRLLGPLPNLENLNE